MLRSLRIATTALVLGAMTGISGAQDYPNGPVTLVVPYPPGGQIDMIARLLQPGLERELGGTVLVENRPGAGGMVGSSSAFRAKPDGQTIVLTTDAVMTLNPLIFNTPGYDPIKDTAAVTIVSESVLALAVKKDMPVTNLDELIEHSKANKVTYGSSGAPQQIVGELIAQRSGALLSYIPYPGVAQVMTDVMGGHIGLGIGTISSIKPHVDAGAMKILAISNSERLASMPDMPIISESVEGVVANTWSGIFAPAGTPQPIIDKLNGALAKILADEELRSKLEGTSEVIVASTPRDASERVVRDMDRWKSFLETVDIPKQ